MSGRFDELIRFIPIIEDKDFGEWIVDRDNDGTTEKPLQIPFVNYSQCVCDVGRILRTFKIKKNVEVTDNGKIII